MKSNRLSLHLSKGKIFDLSDIHCEDNYNSITLDSMALSLSKQCRYNGNSKFFYSVAHHVKCMYDQFMKDYQNCDDRDWVYKTGWQILMHDSAEQVTGDVASPIKALLDDDWYFFEKQIEEVYFSKFEVGEIDPVVWTYDQMAYETELVYCFDEDRKEGVKIFDKEIYESNPSVDYFNLMDRIRIHSSIRKRMNGLWHALEEKDADFMKKEIASLERFMKGSTKELSDIKKLVKPLLTS